MIPPVETPDASVDVCGQLRIFLVGPFRVRRHDKLMPNRDVGSRKARTLLALLAVEPRRLTGVEVITEALWATEPRRAVQDIATMVSRLRSVLGWHAIAGGRTGYRLGGGVRVDLYDAIRRVETATLLLRTDEYPAALRAARSALNTLQPGGVLDDMPAAVWAEPARLAHTAALRRARHAVTEAAVRTRNAELAQRVAEAALHSDPLDETACRLAMRAHAVAGEPARAVTEFQRLRARLAEELGVDPAAETQELHIAVLRGTVQDLASVAPVHRPPAPSHLLIDDGLW